MNIWFNIDKLKQDLFSIGIGKRMIFDEHGNQPVFIGLAVIVRYLDGDEVGEEELEYSPVFLFNINEGIFLQAFLSQVICDQDAYDVLPM